MHRRILVILATATAFGCPSKDVPPPRATPQDLVINEVVTSNLGGGPTAGRDEFGEWDDWLELENRAGHDIDLAGLWVSDRAANPLRYQLPQDEPIVLAAGARVMLFGDGELHQGPRHLPFALSKGGETLTISTSTGAYIDRIEVPEMPTGESFARVDDVWQRCVTPTPNGANQCVQLPVLPPTYDPYVWPTPWPPLPEAPVHITELTRDWIELHNTGSAIDLSALRLSFGTVTIPAPLPHDVQMNVISMSGQLAAGARVRIDAQLPERAAVLLSGADGSMWDRVGFESLPTDNVLARPEDGRAIFLSCDLSSATPGAPNGACQAPNARTDAPPYLRAIRSRADLTRLAEHDGERTSDAQSVKFVIDRLNENTVYFIDSERWKLHFDWTWEVIDGRDPFDMCDPADHARHDNEWARFSQLNYFATNSRRYYLGTLVRYEDSDLYTVEFASGDLITTEQIRDVFFLVAANVFNPTDLFVRPTTASFEERVVALEGHVPIVPAQTPFKGTRFVALNPGIAYGVLQRVAADEVEEAALSFQSIPIFERIPNDVPLVGGTITEELQTPLAHVNVLAQNRGTPNMALLDASSDPRIAPYLDRLVRLEVTQGAFDIRVATSSEAEAFWAERFGSPPPFVPERDLSVRDIVDLTSASFDDLPRIGAKAAQYAELMNLDFRRYSGGGFGACGFQGVQDLLPVPRPGYAIPFARFVEHLDSSGANDMLEALLADEAVLANPAERRAALSAIRDQIEDAPVDPTLESELEALVAEKFGKSRVRLRSSTNVEDLVGFNGAGLYESKSAQAHSKVRPIDVALKQVWASTFAFRAFEERRLFNVDETKVAMAVLIHHGFPGEEANGVAITKNVIDPERFGYYVNAQVGEISIVNPVGNFIPEQLLYKAFVPPEVTVLERSSITGGAPVLSELEVFRLACVIGAAHNRFRDHYAPVIDPADFALDVEFKIDGPERDVVIKQARPYLGRRAVIATGCE